MKRTVLGLVFSGMLATQAAADLSTPPEKLALCVACHGKNGASINPAWPNLGGQYQRYLIKQLEEFKANKQLKSATMSPIAATLNKRDIEELAAFYAGQPLVKGETPEKFLQRGEQLYRGGDFEKKITACIACHGPRGTGNAQAGFPVISGQHAVYIIQQLQAFKEKKRTNDLNSIMQDISARMGPEDMEAVAYYIQGLS